MVLSAIYPSKTALQTRRNNAKPITFLRVFRGIARPSKNDVTQALSIRAHQIAARKIQIQNEYPFCRLQIPWRCALVRKSTARR